MNDRSFIGPKIPQVRAIGCPHPLSITRGRIDCLVPAGATIRQHAEAMGWRDFVCAEAWVGDRRVPVAHWQEVVPEAGQTLMLRAIPMDRGGGKTALRIVAMLAIVVAAAYTGGVAAPGAAGLLGITSTAGVSAIGHGIAATFSIAGGLEINNLIPRTPR